MILANAHPKCGTNLVKKALGDLGFTHVEGGVVRMKPEPMQLGAQRIVIRGLEPTKGTKLDLDGIFATPDDSFIHAHVAHGPLPRCKMVFIVRHPRAAAVSFLRWSDNREGDHLGLRPCKKHLLRIIRVGTYVHLGPWVRGYAAHIGWLTDPGVCAVRFEDIFSDGGASMRRIARYAGADPERAQHVYENLYGDGANIDGKPVYKGKSTWTGELSDWRALWDDEVETAWRKAGGLNLERYLGYDP